MIEAAPEQVWAAVRDVGAVHQRLLPGHILDTHLDGDTRILTFPRGRVARELIVDVDDPARLDFSQTSGYLSRFLDLGLPDDRRLWLTVRYATRAGQWLTPPIRSARRTPRGRPGSAWLESVVPLHR